MHDCEPASCAVRPPSAVATAVGLGWLVQEARVVASLVTVTDTEPPIVFHAYDPFTFFEFVIVDGEWPSAELLQRCEVLTGAVVEVSGSAVIEQVEEQIGARAEGLPFLAPGFIDIQINGFAGT